VNPNNANPWIGDVREAARVRGIQLEIMKASTESEIDAAFAVLVQQHAEALLIGDDVSPVGTSSSWHLRRAIPSR